ncbi:MAG: RNA polymerase factor sigma-32 [Proteobacteria bacterium]|nr:RNA polymerase factor sigma-32 [Pseudomonadota bacterium]
MNTVVYAAPDDGLARYLREVRKFPMLDAEVERALATRWRDSRDPKAAERLAASYLRLAVKIAKGYAGYGLPLADLISEGHVGLMQAIDKFDPDRDVRLATYATWWIRAAIQGYVLRNSSLVRMGTTPAQKKLFYNLRRLKAGYGELGDGDLKPETVAAIARDLGVAEPEVVEMNRRMAAADYSLNVSPGEDSESEFLDLVVDETADQETALAEADEMERRRTLVGRALDRLTPRERDILARRRLTEDPPTLETLSRRYRVSRERVRQIEARAVEKLQKAVRAGAPQAAAAL